MNGPYFTVALVGSAVLPPPFFFYINENLLQLGLEAIHRRIWKELVRKDDKFTTPEPVLLHMSLADINNQLQDCC